MGVAPHSCDPKTNEEQATCNESMFDSCSCIHMGSVDPPTVHLVTASVSNRQQIETNE